MVFLRIPMGTVNHHYFCLSFLLQGLPCSFNTFGIKISAYTSSPKDDKAIFVAARLVNSRSALFGNTHEAMFRSSSTNSINGNTQVSISPILEADREGETRRELSM